MSGGVAVEVDVDLDVVGVKSKSIDITEFLGSTFLVLICSLMSVGHSSL
jgi:hypothetical protein